jgi:uncharacterized protein YjeT (DUF2065 family)
MPTIISVLAILWFLIPAINPAAVKRLIEAKFENPVEQSVWFYRLLGIFGVVIGLLSLWKSN